MPALVTSVGLFKPDTADGYAYPQHIDAASLAALPAAPGVYVFEDENGKPLYIGKSVNIRSRVLSHLRTPDEARLLQQTRRVSFRRTAGEIGALLLESRLIKELQPVHNKKLRRTREMCAFRLEDGVPALVYARDLDFSRSDNLYGLFATRRAALEKLREIVDAHRLCPALCALEARSAPGRPCFASQLGRCSGACMGREAPEQHAQRLQTALDALRVITWPYRGPIGIVESDGSMRQMHVIDHWYYLGTQDAPFRASRRPAGPGQFDVDTYAILVKPLMLGALDVRPLTQRAVRTEGNAGAKAAKGRADTRGTKVKAGMN